MVVPSDAHHQPMTTKPCATRESMRFSSYDHDPFPDYLCNCCNCSFQLHLSLFATAQAVSKDRRKKALCIS